MAQDDMSYAQQTADEVIFWKGAFAKCIIENTDGGAITPDVALYIGCDMVGQAIMHTHMDGPGEWSLEDLIEMAKANVETSIRNYVSNASHGTTHN